MPLHLLGKKSWNVYNADNIARMRRDEADARAREEAAEQRMQEADAARRLAILRGETPPPLPSAKDDERGGPAEEAEGAGKRSGSQGRRDDRFGGLVRKRKRAGEDDTDFEMRVARERAELAAKRRGGDNNDPAPPPEGLVDQAGHIALFVEPPSLPPKKVPAVSSLSTATAATARRPRMSDRAVDRDEPDPKEEAEKQFQVRLTDAAGRDGVGLIDGGPWYAKKDVAAAAAAAGRPDIDLDKTAQKNAWGKEDLGRRNREAGRISASDPLMIMRMGAARVRSLETERKRDGEERDHELRALRKEERRREKERRRERGRESERGRERHRRGAKDGRPDEDGGESGAEHIEPDRRGRSDRRQRSQDPHKERRRGSEHRRDRQDAEHRRYPDGHRHRRSY